MLKVYTQGAEEREGRGERHQGAPLQMIPLGKVVITLVLPDSGLLLGFG